MKIHRNIYAMIILNKFTFLLTLLVMTLATACVPGLPDEEEEDKEKGPLEFTDGIYVINQGLTQNTDQFGSLTFVERGEDGRSIRDVYRNNNPTRELGNRTRSMRVINQLGYIISTNANRIDVVNVDNFQYQGPILGLEKPRFILPVSPGIAWVSQWGDDGFQGSIAVVDLSTNTVLRTIPVRPGPEEMVIQNGNVYVANSGGFLLDSVVTKIDIETETILKEIEVGLQPQSIEIDVNRSLWVLTRGVQEFDQSRDGRLVQLSNDQVTREFVVDQGAGNLTINNSGDRLYYTMRGAVFAHPITQSSISLAPFIDFPYLTVAVDPQTDHIIGADARNFQVTGRIVIHSPAGEELEEHTVGIVPIDFWFE